MSKYNNSSPNIMLWTNHKLCQVIKEGIYGNVPMHPFKPGQFGMLAIAALQVLEGRVVRHKPNPDYDERGAPRTITGRITSKGPDMQTLGEHNTPPRGTYAPSSAFSGAIRASKPPTQ